MAMTLSFIIGSGQAIGNFTEPTPSTKYVKTNPF